MITQKFFMGGGGKAGPITAGTTQSRGCTLTRYKGGVGTFIEYKAPDGSDAVMEVIDARYRTDTKYKWADSDTIDTGIPNIVMSYYYIYNNNEYALTSPMAAAVTMSYLLSKHGSKWTADGTATANNEYIKTPEYPAGYYCNSLSVDSVNGKWLLPTCWQMHVIWMLSDDIDAIENPDASYARCTLGYVATGWRFSGLYFWSCSEESASCAWYVNGKGRVLSNGYIKVNADRILPIREH